jgi:hypothetical protein
MGNATIFVRVLGEAVDCWRPVDAIGHGPSRYRIVGPAPTPDEEWEFRIGEVVRCRERDGQLRAVQLIEAAPESTAPRRPLQLRRNPTDAKRGALAEAVAKAIDESDPIGLLAIGAPADEYDPEVRTILPRLPGANGVEDVLAIVHEEFSRWFGADTAGPRQAYESAASRIWDAVRRYRYAG